MEISGNKYLHKKFKKQTSCSPPVYIAEDNTNDKNGTVPPVTTTKFGNGELLPPSSFLLFKDNKPVGSVPNYKSTNCDTTSSIVIDPHHNTTSFNLQNKQLLNNQSSISEIEVPSSTTSSHSNNNNNNNIVKDQPVVSSAVQYYNNTISTNPITTTTSCFLDNEFKERNFSFDTKVNFSEPNHPNIIEKSSILVDTVYSKCSVISEPQNTTLVDDKKSICPESTSSNTNSASSGGKYVCTYCNLACSKPSVLQKHIRAHTNERPYPCVSCGFSFKTRSNLYKHCRSRTHANRVMGNKHVQAGQLEILDVENVSSERMDCVDDAIDTERIADNVQAANADSVNVWEQKTKPYKPRFHTAKYFLEETKLKENDAKLDNISFISSTNNIKTNLVESLKNRLESQETIKTNPDMLNLKLRINELINKNNSIVNCDEAMVFRRRNNDNYVEHTNNNSGEYIQQIYQPEYRTVVDEPLNLTAKNRKRCLSDSDNTHQQQKSLIKELLLKNLSADPNLQCPYCKMIFQTVTELEMHKFKYCNAKNNSNIRYARSSSVNVASILTQNKHALDNIPHMQHTTFPLKSPGPFLGKTRLIENEKSRTFSFDDNVIMHHSHTDSSSFTTKYMLHSPVGNYSLSPQVKRNPIKLFGGEVKITQTSGETRSFKIESESINKMSQESTNFIEFNGGNLSENLVIKSTLQSGGTVLQNKANYSPKLDSLPSPNVIRVYENTDIVSPNLNAASLLNEKSKFTYDKIPPRQNDKLLVVANNEQPLMKRGYPVQDNGARTIDVVNVDKEKELYKSNLIDFGQKAVKMLAPNLKPPNLSIPGLPIPVADKIYHSPTVMIAPIEINIERESVIDKQQHLENINFANKQISLQQRMAEVSQPQHIYNPMNLFVNGKVIRYVPGIPGPIAEAPVDAALNRLALPVKVIKDIPKSPRSLEDSRDVKDKSTINGKTPTIIVDQHEIRQNFENKCSMLQNRSLVAENKLSPLGVTIPSPEKLTVSKEESLKFIRPNSLALKLNPGAFKTHHGLTPTMFNQALISPDTPRVAKKYCQQYLNGNYFSYLGLKSSTKSVYCTLNKTQPFYVQHFKKLSMYSEWRQQESKIDSLSISAYDSRQQQQKYTLAGQAKADLIAHSSYKFVTTEHQLLKEENSSKGNSVFGGYESNEDYTYIRGRGRGRYVCDQCGIRCKKPSMLKKHIRTHSDDRPYTCEQCNFSFKTKGNLTKHMKSKAHSKKYLATSSNSTPNSVTTSSDSDESDAESSDESTRLQEHEAAHCLLSLSQKNNQPLSSTNQDSCSSTNTSFHSTTVSITSTLNLTEFPSFLKDEKFLKNPDQINQVTNANFAKNKILDETPVNFNASKHLIAEVLDVPSTSNQDTTNNISQYLGKSSTIRPLTYPYLQTQLDLDKDKQDIPKSDEKYKTPEELQSPRHVAKPPLENRFAVITSRAESITHEQKSVVRQNEFVLQNVEGNLPANIVFRKRKLSTCSGDGVQYKMQCNDVTETNIKAVDLSVPQTAIDLSPAAATNPETISFNGAFLVRRDDEHSIKLTSNLTQRVHEISEPQMPYNAVNNNESVLVYNPLQKTRHSSFSESNSSETFSQSSDTNDRLIGKSVELTETNLHVDLTRGGSQTNNPEYGEQDQSAMQTLADIAIKQVKLEKNILAKNVASEYLKLALNNDAHCPDGKLKSFVTNNKDSVNDLMVKPEENKNCSICSKNFSKPSQLRLHMNIHYLERPFRCESCSVSFRTKGHLQKHERSASHHNKLSTSPALSSSEPRPFKCTDCNIAFRIQGHLAKHLRSKMHIMKLECLAKIPFGLYAELERANSLLTEINTTDGDLCLESLKILARKLFSNDPNKLDQIGNGPENRDS